MMTPTRRSVPAQIFLLFLVLAFAVSCTHRAPQTVEEALWAVNAQGLALTNTVNEARRNGLITREQHSDALDRLQSARNATIEGLRAWEAGNITGAQDWLEVAEGALRVVETLLPPMTASIPRLEYAA